MSENFNVSVTFKVVSASCGHVYCVPSWVFGYTCPMCAAEEIRHANRDRDAAVRSVSRLRGVITTLKRRPKR